MMTVNIDGKDWSYNVGDRWKVEVGKGEKGKYHSRYTLDTPHMAMRYFNAINIGRGFKKRLSLVQNGKKVTVAKATS